MPNKVPNKVPNTAPNILHSKTKSLAVDNQRIHTKQQLVIPNL